MAENDYKKSKVAEETGYGFLAVFLWCSVSGLMLLHFVSFFVGLTSPLLLAVGFFVPPVGLINGLVFTLTGDSVQQYY